MFQIDEAVFRPLFNKIDSNGDSEVSLEEFDPMMGPHWDEFLAQYWHIFDKDYSATLNFEECMYVSAAIADGFARLYIKVRT